VHRAIFGSIERFFGILVENTAGDFPLWLSPVQARLLPVTEAVSWTILFASQARAVLASTRGQESGSYVCSVTTSSLVRPAHA
jgi:threonyl-tRNA synthetase